MSWTTTLSVEELATHLDACILVDCRHRLDDPQAGRRAWEEAHSPTAHFLSIDDDLSGRHDPSLGRHPMPDRAPLREKLAALGLSDDTQLVLYDDQGGAMAGRLWMLARWLGHEKVALLDGGFDAWKRAGYPLTAEPTAPRKAGQLSERPSLVQLLNTAQLQAALQDGHSQVVDARGADRYRGENETIDPVAGHIPGALNRPFMQNLRPDGRFKPAEVLRDEWERLLAGRSGGHHPPVRLGRDGQPQPADHGTGRPARQPPVPAFVERLDQRSGKACRQRLKQPSDGAEEQPPAPPSRRVGRSLERKRRKATTGAFCPTLRHHVSHPAADGANRRKTAAGFENPTSS